VNERKSYHRVWLLGTVVLVVLALLALAVLEGPRERLALVGCAVAEAWLTVTVVRSWLFLLGYRRFWWWRR
jgi:hypothetical protein